MSVTTSDREKLDETLKILLQLNEQMNSFEKKLEDFNIRLTDLNQKIDDRCYELESLMENKADASDVVEVFERLEVLEAKERD